MSRNLVSLARAFVALCAIGMLAFVVATPAQAATEHGTLTFNPGKGLDSSPVWAISSAPCPAAAKWLSMSMYGKGIQSDGLVVMSTTMAGLSRTGRMLAAFQDNLAGVAASNGFSFSPGPYKVVLNCQDKFGTTVYGSFTGTIEFTDAHHFTAPYTALTFPSGELPGGRPVIASTAPTPTASGSTPGSSASPAASGSPVPSASGAVAVPSSSAASLDPSSATGSVSSASSSAHGSDSSMNWVFGGAGALLVLLGVGWVLKDRLSSAKQTSDDSPVEAEEEHVSL